MPQPPSMVDGQNLLQQLFDEVQNQNGVAASRHEEILARMIEHQEMLAEARETSKHLDSMFGTGLANGLIAMPSVLATSAPAGFFKESTQLSTASTQRDAEVLLEVAKDDCQVEILPPQEPLAALENPRASELAGGLKQNNHLDISAEPRAAAQHPEARTKWGKIAQDIVNHNRFELFIAFVIMANAIVMCFEVQFRGFNVGHKLKYRGYEKTAEETWASAEITFSVLDWFFGAVFSLEFAVKLFSFGHSYFYVLWNCLDFFCVLAFVFDKVGSAFLPIQTQALRLLRMIRLFRLVRVLRNLESLDVLFVMTTAIRDMTSILFWAVSLLTVMLMTCALFLTQILQSTYFDGVSSSSMSDADLVKNQMMYEYFGTTSRCMLSMFELALANWAPVTRLLSEETTEWFMLICVAHKLTIGFAVIGVINGVIMQETFKVAATDDMIMVRQKKRAKATLKKKMMNLLDALDHSDDGMLDYGEFEIIASQPDVKLWLGSMDIETDDIRTLFRLIDQDSSGYVSADELCARIARLKGTARSIDVMALREDFKLTKNHLHNPDAPQYQGVRMPLPGEDFQFLPAQAHMKSPQLSPQEPPPPP